MMELLSEGIEQMYLTQLIDVVVLHDLTTKRKETCLYSHMHFILVLYEKEMWLTNKSQFGSKMTKKKPKNMDGMVLEN